MLRSVWIILNLLRLQTTTAGRAHLPAEPWIPPTIRSSSSPSPCRCPRSPLLRLDRCCVCCMHAHQPNRASASLLREVRTCCCNNRSPTPDSRSARWEVYSAPCASGRCDRMIRPVSVWWFGRRRRSCSLEAMADAFFSFGELHWCLFFECSFLQLDILR